MRRVPSKKLRVEAPKPEPIEPLERRLSREEREEMKEMVLHNTPPPPEGTPFRDDISWQAYSPRMWERMSKELKKGRLWARANLPKICDFFEASDEYQQAVCGSTYPEVRNRLKTFKNVGWILLALCLAASWPVIQGAAPFYWVIGALLYQSFYKSARANSRDGGVFGLAFVCFAAIAYVSLDKPLLVVFEALSVLTLVWPFVIFGVVRKACIKLLIGDYHFFKHMTGRAYDCLNRPTVGLVKVVNFNLAATPWDINTKPMLSDLQINSPYPTIIGRNYDYYFSRFFTRLFLFCATLGLAFTCKGLIWPSALGVSLLTSFMFVWVCPSEQFVDFRNWLNDKGNSGDKLTTYLLWFAISALVTFVLVYFSVKFLQYIFPIVQPPLEAQLDDLFPHWRRYVPKF